MTDAALTIADLLFDWPGEASRDALPGYRRDDQTVRIRSSLEEVAEVEWEDVAGEIDSVIRGMFDVRFEDVVWKAWLKYAELQEYRDPARHPPEEVALLPLLKHDIVSTHQPYVEVLVGDSSVGRIEFTLRITMSIEAVTMKIQAGRIREVKTGACRFRGELRCGPAVLIDKRTEAFELPGRLRCGDGIEIPALPLP